MNDPEKQQICDLQIPGMNDEFQILIYEW